MTAEANQALNFLIAMGECDRSAADILQRAAVIMRSRAIPFEVEQQIDDAASAIILRAQALHCGAIMIGRHGMGIVRAALLGSVSTEVARKYNVPVLMVRAVGGVAREAPVRSMCCMSS